MVASPVQRAALRLGRVRPLFIFIILFTIAGIVVFMLKLDLPDLPDQYNNLAYAAIDQLHSFWGSTTTTTTTISSTTTTTTTTEGTTSTTTTAFTLYVYMWENQWWSWGKRINGAFKKFAPPWVKWVEHRREANVELFHMDETAQLERLQRRYRKWMDLSSKQLPPEEALPQLNGSFLGLNEFEVAKNLSHHWLPIAVVQHAMDYEKSRRWDWLPFWKLSLMTASFFDLSQDSEMHGFTYLPLPWGADEFFFTPYRYEVQRKSIVIIGDHESSHESHDEVLLAAAHAGFKVRHVGDEGKRLCKDCNFNPKRAVRQRSKAEWKKVPMVCRALESLDGSSACDFHVSLGRVSDEKLRYELQTARYVAVLRKHEGFEIAGIEALFSGTRPVIYDWRELNCYRWFRNHSTFVSSRLDLPTLLIKLNEIFETPPTPVSPEEMAELHAKFSWGKLVPNFFNLMRKELMKVQIPTAESREQRLAWINE